MFKGLQSLWGSFGQAVERFAVKTADALRTVFGLARVGQAPVDVPVLRQELANIRRGSETAPQLVALSRNEAIPENLYTESNIPWKQPFAYRVEFYGRDLATGMFAHIDRVITSSSELTPGEVLDIAGTRFGGGGAYPVLDIRQMAVTGAYTRAGEISF